MKFGIIGAMDVEVELLKKEMEIEDKLIKANMEFYSGTLLGKEVVVVRSGIGKVNAAVCSQILLDNFAVEAVLFTGVAGAIDRDLDMGDIIISTDVVQHDVDITAFGRDYGEIPELDQVAFKADEKLVTMAKEIGEELAQTEAIEVITGRILSGDQFISDEKKVEWLRETFAGQCTEMEGAAVGQVAYLNDTPFVIIRSISDKADEEADMSFDEFVEFAANNSYKMITEILKRL
ncbi:5'-methylthioadenosine/adenosylhomocysteine nucleosidase [Natroniella sulfidigena]|uniref:5'-methylthioadenosine/adenosylhomocysteine nucleosidase n=1 Tax=Natroniella sulfidigena TaxID=723921 RepID=UPI00200ABFB9|nr:5'-methylthioadenosine/adenosylhomocysteine nucleosidase [Natroniella sulfidigena]MCK8817709.1 5'-methylthioadenosine/adenosylhomocysteine nucleosidase [Natroniella sulfidigena]